jgi:hypothetical protein
MQQDLDIIGINQKQYCKTCVLPEAKPNIFFNEHGICNICLEFENEKKIESESKLLETDLLKIISKHKTKGKYDVLAMCSGGKDSTSALYYMKTRYNLNPLAFMFDNGFESKDAIENVQNAVDKLGVDFLFFKSSYMKNMYQKILETNSKAVICHPCSLWYMDLAYETADRYEIPLIIAGWTKGQSTSQKIMNKCGCNTTAPEFKNMGNETKDFIEKYVRNDPKYKDFPKSMEEVIKKASSRKNKAIVLSPHWFLPFGPEEYVPTIQKELNWKYPQLSYPGRSTNCNLNFISVINSLRDYGYTHYHVEMSKLIRQGVITRDEAIKDLEFKVSKHDLNNIAQKLNYKYE